MQTALLKSLFLSAALMITASTAHAQSGLIGREITFQVLTYDDPATLLFEGLAHSAQVTEGIEFGLQNEGIQNQIDVVPVLVDVSNARIELRYSNADPGELWTSGFNGYVITVNAPCNMLATARVDQAFTNLQFDNKRVRIDGNRLLLNVSGQKYDRDSRIGVDLTLTDCVGS